MEICQAKAWLKNERTKDLLAGLRSLICSRLTINAPHVLMAKGNDVICHRLPKVALRAWMKD